MRSRQIPPRLRGAALSVPTRLLPAADRRPRARAERTVRRSRIEPLRLQADLNPPPLRACEAQRLLLPGRLSHGARAFPRLRVGPAAGLLQHLARVVQLPRQRELPGQPSPTVGDARVRTRGQQHLELLTVVLPLRQVQQRRIPPAVALVGVRARLQQLRDQLLGGSTRPLENREAHRRSALAVARAGVGPVLQQQAQMRQV